jgi:hypothetical protein
VQHQGNVLGDGKNVDDVTMDNPQPSAFPWGMVKVQRLDGGGCTNNAIRWIWGVVCSA